MMTANNENGGLMDATLHDKRTTSPRKVLGDLSSNVQMTPRISLSKEQKSSTGTPLKRSFNASIGDAGFTYLKRRRLSSSSSPIDVAQSTERLVLRKDASVMGASHAQGSNTMQSYLEEDPAGDTERDSSSERRSFSSLINYDPSSQTGPSSQNHNRADLDLLRTDTTNELSRAELLRIRLQVAMYKVRTQQTTVTFDLLREDTASGSRESSKAVREAVEQLREEARAKLIRTQKPEVGPAIAQLSLLPVSQTNLTLSPERKSAIDRSYLLTPDVRHRNSSHLSARPELTSSAVKGQVAEGLLGLKNGF